MAQTLQKIYSDLDLTFQINPITKDVSLSYDDNAVIRSVRNLILTNYYERLFQPDLGGNVEAHLFELATPTTTASLETEITDVINNFEPRVTLISVNVVGIEDKNSYYIELSFFIGNNTQPTNINLLLQRTR